MITVAEYKKILKASCKEHKAKLLYSVDIISRDNLNVEDYSLEERLSKLTKEGRKAIIKTLTDKIITDLLEKFPRLKHKPDNLTYNDYHTLLKYELFRYDRFYARKSLERIERDFNFNVLKCSTATEEQSFDLIKKACEVKLGDSVTKEDIVSVDYLSRGGRCILKKFYKDKLDTWLEILNIYEKSLGELRLNTRYQVSDEFIKALDDPSILEKYFKELVVIYNQLHKKERYFNKLTKLDRKVSRKLQGEILKEINSMNIAAVGIGSVTLVVRDNAVGKYTIGGNKIQFMPPKVYKDLSNRGFIDTTKYRTIRVSATSAAETEKMKLEI